MSEKIQKLMDVFFHFNPKGTNKELAEFMYCNGFDAGFAKCEKSYGLKEDEEE
jgi:hypothetical protein